MEMSVALRGLDRHRNLAGVCDLFGIAGPANSMAMPTSANEDGSGTAAAAIDAGASRSSPPVTELKAPLTPTTLKVEMEPLKPAALSKVEVVDARPKSHGRHGSAAGIEDVDRNRQPRSRRGRPPSPE